MKIRWLKNRILPWTFRREVWGEKSYYVLKCEERVKTRKKNARFEKFATQL